MGGWPRAIAIVESDDDGLAFDDLKYSCGCREIRHVYHDGYSLSDDTT